MSIEAPAGVVDDGLRLLTAILHPHLEGRVVRALHERPEFPGFDLTEARGQGRGQGRGEGRGRGASGTYVASGDDLTHPPHLQIQMVCNVAAVDLVLSTVARAGRIGRRGDGVVFVTPVERFVRIGEAGEAQSQTKVQTQAPERAR